MIKIVLLIQQKNYREISFDFLCECGNLKGDNATAVRYYVAKVKFTSRITFCLNFSTSENNLYIVNARERGGEEGEEEACLHFTTDTPRFKMLKTIYQNIYKNTPNRKRNVEKLWGKN